MPEPLFVSLVSDTIENHDKEGIIPKEDDSPLQRAELFHDTYAASNQISLSAIQKCHA